MVSQFSTINISNSSIMFFGKKNDLRIYSLSCKNFNDDKILDEDPVLCYHIYLENSAEEMESFRILMGDSNVSTSGGIIISV